jgi:hypothetical protein
MARPMSQAGGYHQLRRPQAKLMLWREQCGGETPSSSSGHVRNEPDRRKSHEDSVAFGHDQQPDRSGDDNRQDRSERVWALAIMWVRVPPTTNDPIKASNLA